jgi:hypothetical protein
LKKRLFQGFLVYLCEYILKETIMHKMLMILKVPSFPRAVILIDGSRYLGFSLTLRSNAPCWKAAEQFQALIMFHFISMSFLWLLWFMSTSSFGSINLRIQKKTSWAEQSHTRDFLWVFLWSWSIQWLLRSSPFDILRSSSIGGRIHFKDFW